MVGWAGHSWRVGGYEGCGNVEPFLGSLQGRTAVVCGNAQGVFEQMEYVLSSESDPVVVAVNDVGMFLPRLDHWVSLHSDQFSAWRAVRWLQRRQEVEAVRYHGVDAKHQVDYAWELLTPSLLALSGYFALQVAYLGGAGKIVMCGCPGDQTRRFFEVGPRVDGFGYGQGPTLSDNGVKQQLISEMRRLPKMKEKIRSMSGWTKQFFGGY